MKDFFSRPRNWFLLAALLWVAVWYATGLDSWAETTQGLLKVVGGVLIAALVHFGRKWLHDYVDMRELYLTAKQTPLGSALVFVGMTIVMLWLSLVFIASAYGAPIDPHTFVPQGANEYAPQLRIEQQQYWSDHPGPKF